MTRSIEKIENELLSLPQEERAFLADRLLSSLDREVLTEIDLAWVNEAERRYVEYKSGKRQGVNSDLVFSEADRMLKWHLSFLIRMQKKSYCNQLYITKNTDPVWVGVLNKQ